MASAMVTHQVKGEMLAGLRHWVKMGWLTEDEVHVSLHHE